MNHEFFGEVVHSYSRSDALRDGVLVDVSDIAADVGFAVPVALSQEVYATVLDMPQGLGQTIDARVHDVLVCAAFQGLRNPKVQRVEFEVGLLAADARLRVQKLLVDIGPGDDHEPVVTIGYPRDF